MRIEHCTEKDFLKVVDISLFCLESQSISKDELLKSLNDNSNFCFVAKNDSNDCLGFVLCSSSVDFFDVLSLAVKKDFRRHGVGFALMNRVLDKANEDRKSVFLEVASQNIAASTLYEKLGFENISTRKKYYQNKDDALIFKKSFKQ